MPAASNWFASRANDYAKFRPRYPPALYDWLAQHVAAYACVWDAGCGSGQATLALAEKFAHVFATDISAEQLALATRHPRITYSQAAAEQSGLASASLHLITVAQALHWFDLPRFYTEVQRVLCPAGWLVVWTYAPLTLLDMQAQAVLQKFYINTALPWFPPGREHVDNAYASLHFPYPEASTPGLRIAVRFTLDELIGYVRSWSAMARLQQASGVDATLELRESLSALPQAQQEMEGYWQLKIRAGQKPA